MLSHEAALGYEQVQDGRAMEPSGQTPCFTNQRQAKSGVSFVPCLLSWVLAGPELKLESPKAGYCCALIKDWVFLQTISNGLKNKTLVDTKTKQLVEERQAGR